MRGLSELAASARTVAERTVRPLIRRLRRHLLPRGEKDQDSALAGMMVTLSPQPQASVSFGLRNTNLAASRLVS